MVKFVYPIFLTLRELNTGLREIAGLIDYLNHLVLAKIDLEDYLKIKLPKTTDKSNIRSRTDWKQIDRAQWQLFSYKARKCITFIYGRYCWTSALF